MVPEKDSDIHQYRGRRRESVVMLHEKWMKIFCYQDELRIQPDFVEVETDARQSNKILEIEVFQISGFVSNIVWTLLIGNIC